MTTCSVQFGYPGDWNKAMVMGPWFFRNQAVLMEEYDGFGNPRSVFLEKLTVWVQVHKLLDNYLHEQIVRGMCRTIGEVKEVQLRLPASFVGELAGSK